MAKSDFKINLDNMAAGESKAEAAASQYAKIVFGIAAYATCSSMMLIINKLAVRTVQVDIGFTPRVESACVQLLESKLISRYCFQTNGFKLSTCTALHRGDFPPRAVGGALLPAAHVRGGGEGYVERRDRGG